MKSKNNKRLGLLIVILLSLAFWSGVIAYIVHYYFSKSELSTQTVDVSSVSTVVVTVIEVAKEPYKITVYTPYSDNGKWGYLTATGVKSEHLTTCAVDPKVIPLGSAVEVNGLILKAVDTGSAVKGKVIDIFYDGTNKQASQWLKSFGTNHYINTF